MSPVESASRQKKDGHPVGAKGHAGEQEHHSETDLERTDVLQEHSQGGDLTDGTNAGSIGPLDPMGLIMRLDCRTAPPSAVLATPGVCRESSRSLRQPLRRDS